MDLFGQDNFKTLYEFGRDEHLHIGGDEVRRKCWTENDKVKAWMKKNNFGDEDLESYWMGRVQNISTALGKDLSKSDINKQT